MFFKNKNDKHLEEIKRSFESVFNSPEGNVVLTQIANQCLPSLGVFTDNTQRLSFENGKINIFMFILRMSNIPFEFFLKQYQKNDSFESIFTDLRE